MPTYYADSSVLTKRHVQESGSAWVQGLTDPAAHNTIITAHISMIEVFSALNRRVRESTLSTADYMTIANDFAAICATEYLLVEATPQIIAQARGILERHPLRGYDALQLVTALAANSVLVGQGLNPLIFLAADQRLLAAAQAEGLARDDPNTHP